MKRQTCSTFSLVHQQLVLAAYDTEVLQKIKAAKPAAPIIDITHRVPYIEINAAFSFTEYEGLW